jgi:hypothetical protein
MGYEEAKKKLVEYLNHWKPDGEMAEVLEKALQSFDDCLEMGLTGEGH